MSEPDENQKSLIIEFRDRIKDLTKTEEQRSSPFLLRWIRARDHDLAKAEAMIRSSFEWRENIKADLVLEKAFDPWFPENFPWWIDTYDKDGRPLMEMPLGSWDIRCAMDTKHEADFESWVTRFFESVLAATRTANEKRQKATKDEKKWPITQWTIICDWKGYSYSQDPYLQLMHWKALKSTLMLGAHFEAHYPEILHRAFFINCPSIFPLFFGLLKKVIRPATVAKISCQNNEAEWRPLLLQHIDEDQLGTKYGGKVVRKIKGKVFEYRA